MSTHKTVHECRQQILFIVGKKWKQPKCSSNDDEQINKMLSSHTMEYYSATKRKEDYFMLHHG